MSSDKDTKDLIERLLSGASTGGQKMPSPEEMKAEFEKQEREIFENFKKLETKEIITMLVAAENFLNGFLRSDPPLTRRGISNLQNVKVLISCVLDGKKPDNFDELGPKF